MTQSFCNSEGRCREVCQKGVHTYPLWVEDMTSRIRVLAGSIPAFDTISLLKGGIKSASYKGLDG